MMLNPTRVAEGLIHLNTLNRCGICLVMVE